MRLPAPRTFGTVGPSGDVSQSDVRHIHANPGCIRLTRHSAAAEPVAPNEDSGQPTPVDSAMRHPDRPGYRAARLAGACRQRRRRRHPGRAHRRPGHDLQAGLRPAVRQPLRLPPARAGRCAVGDIFKRYLESLDGGKLFFTAQDIAKFAPYKTKLDDAIKSGDLEPAYAMFALYKQRVDRARRATRAACSSRTSSISAATSARTTTARTRRGPPTRPSSTHLWKQSVRNDWLRLKLAGKKPDEIRKTLDKRYANLARARRTSSTAKTCSRPSSTRTPTSIDPHTDYFDPRSAEQLQP